MNWSSGRCHSPRVAMNDVHRPGHLALFMLLKLLQTQINNNIFICECVYQDGTCYRLNQHNHQNIGFKTRCHNNKCQMVLFVLKTVVEVQVWGLRQLYELTIIFTPPIPPPPSAPHFIYNCTHVDNTLHKWKRRVSKIINILNVFTFISRL